MSKGQSPIAFYRIVPMGYALLIYVKNSIE
jgi:hypothetical protein